MDDVIARRELVAVFTNGVPVPVVIEVGRPSPKGDRVATGDVQSR